MSGNVDELLRELGVPLTPPDRKNQERYRKAASDFHTIASAQDQVTMVYPPAATIRDERPEHTVMAWMRASGKSLQEIATATNYSYFQVREISRQPWFRLKVDRIITECGRDQVEAYLKGEVLESLQTLVEIRDDKTQKGATRVAAVRELLDRGLGKSIARIETKTIPSSPSDATDEVERLRQEVAENARRLAASGITTFQPSAS